MQIDRHPYQRNKRASDAPAYRRVPFATWRESFDLIILMGDSAGGGLSVALTEHLKAERIRLPDELILQVVMR